MKFVTIGSNHINLDMVTDVEIMKNGSVRVFLVGFSPDEANTITLSGAEADAFEGYIQRIGIDLMKWNQAQT